MSNPIPIDPSVMERLDLDRWNRLTERDREEVGRRLAEAMIAAGWQLDRSIAVSRFGPTGEPQPVLQVREQPTGLMYSVIPGGTFEPGISEHLWARYHELYMQMEGWKEREEYEKGEEPWHPEPLEATWTFASQRPCDLRPKPAVRVAPFLLATEQVTGRVTGLRQVLGPLDRYWNEHFEKSAKEGYPVDVRWEKVGPILNRFRWSLPTTEEFEWALRGGVDSLFYWGNDFPDFILVEYVEPFVGGSLKQPERGEERFNRSFGDLMSRNFDPMRQRAWPWCNRFGLAGMLACGTWCEPSQGPADPAPLIVRGGAADCYGWQGCGEWKLLLNAAEYRLVTTSNYADHNAIRPVIRLSAGQDG
jgi:hypothetical protein